MKQVSKINSRSVEEKLNQRLHQIPRLYQNRFREVILGLKGRKQAITMKCCDCVGFEDTAVRIRECSSNLCPLWHHRPYQVKRSNHSEDVSTNGEIQMRQENIDLKISLTRLGDSR